jgi:hemolysin activation/secretion protein
MVHKFRLNSNPSFLPLSVLILTCGWQVAAVNARTVKPQLRSEIQFDAERENAVMGDARNAETFLAASPQVSSLSTNNIFQTYDSSSVQFSEHPSATSKNSELVSPSQLEADLGSSLLETSHFELTKEGNSNALNNSELRTQNLGEIAQNSNPDRQVPSFPRSLPQPLPSQTNPSFPRDIPEPPSQAPLEPTVPTPLPPPEQLLAPSNTTPPTPQPVPGKVPETITIERFEFEGNTAISDEDLAKVTESFTKRSISFAELFQARSAVTQLYLDRGYITSGALIPPQTLDGGVVKIQVIEGGLEGINITGTRRLNPDYIRSRIAIATNKPLNRERLLEALQLLQLNPLIQNLSAELSAGTEPGLSLLEVKVTEAKTRSVQLQVNNNRAPSVGTVEGRIQFNQANLTGAGDSLIVGYSHTEGSNGGDLSYTLPINPRNGTVSFSFGTTYSNVVEPPFDRIDINAKSRYYEFTYRQPIFQTPTQEFAYGLTFSRQESATTLLEIPFPLSLGADDEGRTRISALRFFQEWTKRNSREVIAARSQFSFGLNAFDSTINAEAPDSQFFAWRGQAQWVRLLAPDTLFLVRGDVQLADRALVPLEQIGLGGQQTIRGYRQDLLLTDNGALISAEARFPILRIPKWNTLVQLAPFVDLGTGWNNSGRPDPDPGFLASIGLGLQMQITDRITARLDYGIPLVSVDSSDRTWQENGFYFSIVATPFGTW